MVLGRSPVPGNDFIRHGKIIAIHGLAGILLCLGTVSPGIGGQSGKISSSDGWVFDSAVHKGELYHQDIDGSRFPAVMMATTFDVSSDRVFAVVTDHDHFAEFIPNVVKSRIIRHEGNNQWVFHHLHFSRLIADRVYLMKSTGIGNHPQEGGYLVEWGLSEMKFPDVDLSLGLRPKAFSGFWEIRSADDGTSTEARYAVHSDPGGYIPGWLVTRMTDRYIQQVVAAVRKRLD
jgi:hypothetical protein